MYKNTRTLCFLIDHDQILLTETVFSSKIRRFTGIGGDVKLEKNIVHETIKYLYKDIRVSVYPHDLEKVALIHKISRNEKSEIIADETIHVFTCNRWQGDIKATPGIKPSWHVIQTIPFSEMLESEEKWLSYILEGEKILVEIVEKKTNPDGDFNLINVAIRSMYS